MQLDFIGQGKNTKDSFFPLQNPSYNTILSPKHVSNNFLIYLINNNTKINKFTWVLRAI